MMPTTGNMGNELHFDASHAILERIPNSQTELSVESLAMSPGGASCDCRNHGPRWANVALSLALQSPVGY